MKGSMLLKNAVFDFDGTLVDSRRDVLDSLTKAFKKCGLPAATYASPEIVQFQLREAIAAIAPRLPAEQIEKVIGAFREMYDECGYPHTRLMPGVAGLLPKLKDRSVGMFIVSNKRAVPTLRILDKFNIRRFFTGIFNPDMDGAGTPPSKSELLARVLKKYSLARNATAYIGDAEGDVVAAKENGITAIAVNNGYGTTASFKVRPDRIVRRINEILTV
jgi:phosphoglycolate phosphatase